MTEPSKLVPAALSDIAQIRQPESQDQTHAQPANEDEQANGLGMESMQSARPSDQTQTTELNQTKSGLDMIKTLRATIHEYSKALEKESQEDIRRAEIRFKKVTSLLPAIEVTEAKEKRLQAIVRTMLIGMRAAIELEMVDMPKGPLGEPKDQGSKGTEEDITEVMRQGQEDITEFLRKLNEDSTGLVVRKFMKGLKTAQD